MGKVAEYLETGRKTTRVTVAKLLEADREKTTQRIYQNIWHVQEGIDEERRIAAEHVESDRRESEERAAKRLEKDRLEAEERAAKRLKTDRYEAEKRAAERLDAQRRRAVARSESNSLDRSMPLSEALKTLKISDKVHLTMEHIYSAWQQSFLTFAMGGMICDPLYIQIVTSARDVLLDSVAKLLVDDVSVPPMDHKSAASLLEIPENAPMSHIEKACEFQVTKPGQPLNGMERYMREMEMNAAKRAMLARM